MNVDVEKMLATLWMHEAGQSLPMDEETVAKAVIAYELPPEGQLVVDALRFVRFTDQLRRAGLFVIDLDDIPLDVLAPETYGDLPPLPFPIVWYEFVAGEADHFMSIGKFTDLDNRPARLLGICVVEKEPSVCWRVYMVLQDDARAMEVGRTNLDTIALREYDLQQGPKFGTQVDEIIKSGISDEAGKKWMAYAYGIPVGLANYVNVLGATVQETSIPRPHRRRFKRAFEVEHPKVYTVNLRSAGDPSHQGDGTREYRHRWIVRGHYRCEDNGKFNVPGKGRCAWVRPHVKGPIGAPWKGRAVHLG